MVNRLTELGGDAAYVDENADSIAAFRNIRTVCSSDAAAAGNSAIQKNKQYEIFGTLYDLSDCRQFLYYYACAHFAAFAYF